MKRILFTIVLFGSIVLSAKAQTDSIQYEEPQQNEMKTVFGKINSHGFYVDAACRYSQINGDHAYMSGGKVAWLMNHNFALGVAGYSFMTQYQEDAMKNYNEYRLSGGYGGLLLEGTFFYRSPVHVTVPVVIGAGGGAYTQKRYYEDYGIIGAEDVDAFFVIEPGLEVEFNILSFFRLGLGAYYRYATPLEMTYYNTGNALSAVESDALNGMSYGITLKFGKF